MTNKLVPLDGMDRIEWIKFQLRIRGSSLSALARDLGVSRHAPRLALVKPYPRMEKAIAEKLELRPQELWPERYNVNGRPNRTPGRPKKPRHDDTKFQGNEKEQNEKTEPGNALADKGGLGLPKF